MSSGETKNGTRENKAITRRRFLAAVGSLAGSAALAACATPTPQVIKETVVVKETVPVEKVVKETVVVKETTVVEKEKQTAVLLQLQHDARLSWL